MTAWLEEEWWWGEEQGTENGGAAGEGEAINDILYIQRALRDRLAFSASRIMMPGPLPLFRSSAPSLIQVAGWVWYCSSFNDRLCTVGPAAVISDVLFLVIHSTTIQILLSCSARIKPARVVRIQWLFSAMFRVAGQGVQAYPLPFFEPSSPQCICHYVG